MERVLTFHTVCYDRLRILPGEERPIYRAFDPDSPGDAPSVVSMTEEEMTKWICRTEITRKLLFDQFQVEGSSRVYLSVRDPIISDSNTKPGDIDVLILPSDPRRAIAIEVKRVKVVAIDSEAGITDKKNKIQELGAGVSQVNALARMGFSQTYLAVLIQVDGRQRTSENLLFRGPLEETLRCVLDFPRRESLDERVGVVFLLVGQPSGKNLDQAAEFGVCVDHQPAIQEQPVGLNERLARLEMHDWCRPVF